MVVMKNWALCHRGNDFLDPELWTNYLIGNVYGHPRFSDGDPISTSSIVEIRSEDGHKVVKTKNTEYIVYEDDVSRDCESIYPDAYNRLSLTNVDCA